MRSVTELCLRTVFCTVVVCSWGCESHATAVCEDQGDCSQGGDNDWITRCEDEAKLLEHQANSTHCGKEYDRYYACADDHFVCHGATASFPGCGTLRAALEACLARDRKSPCAVLAARQAQCVVTDIDAGAEADAGDVPEPACDLQRQCEARCYLDTAAETCGPRLDELSAFSECAESCPP
jgi:hypothetical protein